MSQKMLKVSLCAAALATVAVIAISSANANPEQNGQTSLKSAGALAFAPDGVLLIGDSAGGQVMAVETGDVTKAAPGKVEIEDLQSKIAAMVGAKANDVSINDIAVNPISGAVYISVSRGRGPDAQPVILRADRDGKLAAVDIAELPHSVVAISDAPAIDAKDGRGRDMRTDAITDLGYVNGQVLVAGLSNEEFASSMRSIPHPFEASAKGASIEMYHGAHGRFETAAPVRTFMTYDVGGKPNVLAAYTCTPLVKIPVEEFKPGAKIMASTIAELGNRNRPLDMIAYKQDGRDYILMANSARGVMKLDAANLDAYESITDRVEKAGVPYETIAQLQNVTQLDKLSENSAVILVAENDEADLVTIDLP